MLGVRQRAQSTGTLWASGAPEELGTRGYEDSTRVAHEHPLLGVSSFLTDPLFRVHNHRAYVSPQERNCRQMGALQILGVTSGVTAPQRQVKTKDTTRYFRASN